MSAPPTPKPDVLQLLETATLSEIADEIHNVELAMRLKALLTHGKKNFALHSKPARTPAKGIKILPAPAVGPSGSTKICDGKLTISGNEFTVTAFRLA